jgi:murein DD-endopeptidase MepM/ murein hydrolase activator NlpD
VAPAPKLAAVRCLDVEGHECVDPLWVEPGGKVELTGSQLQSVTQVLFYGRKGRADDAYVPARPRRSSIVVARVPATARSGPLAVVNDSGLRSRRLTGLVVGAVAVEPPLPRQTGSQPAIGTAISKRRKIFYGGLRKAVFGYRIASSRPVDVSVNVIRLADGAVVRSWRQPQVPPGTVRKVIWDGRGDGTAQPEGYYAFQAVAATATGSVVSPTAKPSDDAYVLYGHMFPIRGKHDFGGPEARFGAGRAGHVHQGQDVFARCGTPLVAARAGKVVYKGYHALAGYYLVVHGSGSGFDYVYMHLRRPAMVDSGDRVYTGQAIGEVGQTGDAVGCHLHLELWSAPGWYKGGQPLDPLQQLKSWDAVS